jgi:hypothetical protein
MDNQGLIGALTKELVDRGQIIEAGFVGLKLHMLQAATDDEIEQARRIYYAGCQHVWASVMSMLDPGSEPTERDLDRMTLINNELDAWVESEKRRRRP